MRHVMMMLMPRRRAFDQLVLHRRVGNVRRGRGAIAVFCFVFGFRRSAAAAVRASRSPVGGHTRKPVSTCMQTYMSVLVNVYCLLYAQTHSQGSGQGDAMCSVLE